MTMGDYTAEISEPIVNAAGTFRVRVEYDTDGINPRQDDWPLGTMVLSHRNYNLPREGDLTSRIDEAFERGGLALAMRYLSVVHDAVVLPVYGYDHGQLRLSAGDRIGSFADRWDSGTAGVIYARRADIATAWGNHPMPSDDEIAGMLKTEVETYDTFSNGEMTGYIIEVQCSRCQQWRHVDSCWGYYSVEEAMEQATHELPDSPDHMASVERCACESTLPSPLGDDARAVIAGLVADSSAHDINTDGITASDAVWAEVRAAFPIELFRAWATDDNYNPDAGY